MCEVQTTNNNQPTDPQEHITLKHIKKTPFHYYNPNQSHAP